MAFIFPIVRNAENMMPFIFSDIRILLVFLNACFMDQMSAFSQFAHLFKIYHIVLLRRYQFMSTICF